MAAQLSLLATNNNSSRLETFPSCPFVPLRFIVSPLFLFLFFFYSSIPSVRRAISPKLWSQVVKTCTWAEQGVRKRLFFKSN